MALNPRDTRQSMLDIDALSQGCALDRIAPLSSQTLQQRLVRMNGDCSPAFPRSAARLQGAGRAGAAEVRQAVHSFGLRGSSCRGDYSISKISRGGRNDFFLSPFPHRLWRSYGAMFRRGFFS